MRKKLIVSGTVILCLVWASLFYINLPTFREKTVSIKSRYKNGKVTLKASYWNADDAEYAALICPGYSCDRQKWRQIAGILVTNGISAMSFDYSGQGASSGTIGFDNAKTDSIPIQIDDAIEKLHQVSGIDYDHIILVGHSMGGRSVLRLLYDYNFPGAETEIKKRSLAAAILFSPEVNYHYNAQASLFAGTLDSEELPWNVFNEACAGDLQVYLYGSTADDIVSHKDVNEIAARLGSHATAGITKGILHSYQMYSPKFAAFLNSALESITGKKAVYFPYKMLVVYFAWFGGLSGILLVLLGLNSGLVWKTDEQVPVLIDPKAFLLRKLLMWIPGTVAAFLVCCVCVVMPFGSPVMNIPYMCFIAGYGIVMLFAYRKGHFKGTEGKLAPLSWEIYADRKTVLKTFLAVILLCLFVWYVLRSTMYRLIPLNFRLFWVIVATVLMSAGYYVSGCESDMFEKCNAPGKIRFLYSLIQYVPLFLLVAFYLVLKSYSGMIGQVQNMLLMYIFCIPLGNYIKKKTGNRIMGALITAFLFQTIMITSAALIAF